MSFPQYPHQYALPAQLLDADQAGRYSNGLIRVVEDGGLDFAVGEQRVLDAIHAGHMETALSQIYMAADARHHRDDCAIHVLHLLDWVQQRADVMDGLRPDPAFSIVRNLPSTQINDRWRWMLPVRFCAVPMTEHDYDEFMLVVRQLELHRDVPRSQIGQVHLAASRA